MVTNSDHITKFQGNLLKKNSVKGCITKLNCQNSSK